MKKTRIAKAPKTVRKGAQKTAAHKKNHLPLEITVLAVVILAGLSLFLLRQSQETAATISAASAIASAPAAIVVTAPSGTTADVGQPQQVKWVSENYSGPTVSVSVIRKVSDNPATYEVVRTVAPAKSNNGNAVWVPAKTDVGENTLVQVGCVSSTQACTAGVSPSSLAVVDNGQYDNMADVYGAIEALYNK